MRRKYSFRVRSTKTIFTVKGNEERLFRWSGNLCLLDLENLSYVGREVNGFSYDDIILRVSKFLSAYEPILKVSFCSRGWFKDEENRRFSEKLSDLIYICEWKSYGWKQKADVLAIEIADRIRAPPLNYLLIGSSDAHWTRVAEKVGGCKVVFFGFPPISKSILSKYEVWDLRSMKKLNSSMLDFYSSLERPSSKTNYEASFRVEIKSRGKEYSYWITPVLDGEVNKLISVIVTPTGGRRSRFGKRGTLWTRGELVDKCKTSTLARKILSELVRRGLW